MRKKLFVVLCLCSLPIVIQADEIAANLMLMNDYSYRQSADLWQRMRAGFQMSHEQTSRVQYFERLYTKNPQSFNRMMTNAMPYLYYLLTQIERDGLPSELALVPGVESTFNPFAINPGDAYAGMWQFVPATGRQYNMLQNSDIDERRDIIKSSNAALTYFVYLHTMFGQWDVAIGAYNWGPGNMYKAVVNSNQTIGHIKYTNLKLRQITVDYVPKVIALASIIENPTKFGVTLPYAANQPYFAIVNPVNQISVEDFANSAQIDTKSFAVLNPQFKDNDYTLTPNSQVLLPQNNQSIYYARVGRVVPQLITAPPVMLASNNQAQNAPTSAQALLQPVDVANIPTPAAEVVESGVVVSSIPAAESIGVATVTPVKTVLADNSASEAQLNNLINNLTTANNNRPTSTNKTAKTVRVIAKPSRAEETTIIAWAKKRYYKVHPGDTLYSIAKKFNTKITIIREHNQIPGNNLIVGQVLTILADND